MGIKEWLFKVKNVNKYVAVGTIIYGLLITFLVLVLISLFLCSCAIISPKVIPTTTKSTSIKETPEKPFKSDRFRNGNENYYFTAPFSEKWEVCYVMDEIVDGSSPADTSWVNNSIYPMNPLPVFEAAGKMGYMIFLDLGVTGKIEIRDYQNNIIFKETFLNDKLNPTLWKGVMHIVNDMKK